MTYTQTLLHRYTEALVHAAHTHLHHEGQVQRKHLDDPRAEIDNRTCLDAFITTFHEEFDKHAEAVRRKHSHDGHTDIVLALKNFTEHVARRLQGSINFSALITGASNIIASYSLEE